MFGFFSSYVNIIYAYICSMVKDRVRAVNWSKLAQISARRDIARGYGAGARRHTTSVPLATQKRPIKASIKLTTNQNYYSSIN